jgi:hypothetical protein
LWEEDLKKDSYATWEGKVRGEAAQAYPYILAELVRAADKAIEPVQGLVKEPSCADELVSVNACQAHGFDRPLGMLASIYSAGAGILYQNVDFNELLLVLTTTSIQKALAGQGGRSGTPGGVIVIPWYENGKIANAKYELYLRVERMP